MDATSILSGEQRRKLLANGRRSARDPAHDPAPAVLLRVEGGDQAWLLAELDPGDPDLAFGLCDPGDGFPCLGTVRLSALAALAERGFTLILDDRLASGATLARYTIAAYRAGRIVSPP